MRAGPKTLRGQSPLHDLGDDVEEQQRRLDELLEEMRDTIEAAEESEPLLADKLYDAVRKQRDRKTSESLESLRRSLQEGLAEDARAQEKVAQGGIRQLREGVEQAASSVLGDETEALRRADQELRELVDQLNREIARHRQPDEKCRLTRQTESCGRIASSGAACRRGPTSRVSGPRSSG